jgi:hypothetical protein
VSVPDGESFMAVDANLTEFRVRLAGIQAPKLDDYFGEQSKVNLATLVSNKTVSIERLRHEDDGSVAAIVTLDGRNINLEQLRAGYAWLAGNAGDVLVPEAVELFKRGETLARFGKMGLWTKFDTVADIDEVFSTGVDDRAAGDSQGPTDRVFNFASRTRATGNTARMDAPASEGDAPAQSLTTTAIQDPKPEAASSAKAPKVDPDCEPVTSSTAVAVKADTVVKAPARNPIKTSTAAAKPYLLGPRGGCFYLTASGGKKYVDRALCNQSAAAAQ